MLTELYSEKFVLTSNVSINSVIGRHLIGQRKSAIVLIPLVNHSLFILILNVGFNHSGVLFITSCPKTGPVSHKWDTLFVTSCQYLLEVAYIILSG